jgi:hypothetical protein
VYKTTVVHALKEHDPVARIHFCNWFLCFVHDAQVDSQLVNTQALLDAGKEVGLEVNPEKTKYILVSRCQKAGQRQSIKIANRYFEDVAKFRYLGTRLTDQNYIHEEIKSRLYSGNACYHSVQSFIIPPAVQECKG